MKKQSPPATVTPLRRPLGVAIVDTLPVVVAGLERLVAEQPDMEVLATATDGADGLASIQGVRRTRVISVVGLGLAGEHDAAWLIRSIRERYPSHAILALGANADPGSVSRALFVGADGFVDKNVAPDRFIDSIRRCAAGEMVLAGPEMSELGDIALALDRRRDIDTRLTTRELQVLTVAAEGLTARQIAERLGVRERTVTTHLGRIYTKLGVGSRLAAIRSATRSGLVAAAVAD